MALVNSKSSLAIILSKLKLFSNPNVKLEQYPTDSEIAAEVLWNSFMNQDIENKTIADFGCGTGILGIGALLLGAKKVFFIELDLAALNIAKENLANLFEEFEIESKMGEFVFLNQDILNFQENVDVVIQNPPFGTRNTHADKSFLEKAFKITNVIYSFHKESTASFVSAVSKDNNFRSSNHWIFDFPLKATQSFHKKRIERIKVGCWRLVKK
ncbi:methyltransferase [Candidatus Woesearchaeota archaeon]|jgi:putative methylase|nr:methyltransferase [Candidatus Woesearchaeota archaeon]